MNLKNTIRIAMYTAMKEHWVEDKKVYSLALQAIEKAEKDAKKEFSENEIIPILQKEIKSYNETLSYAQKENREYIIGECNHAIKLLNKFLPEMLTEDEIKAEINKVLTESNIEPVKKNFGLCMKSLSHLKGKADMKLVSSLLKDYLQ